MASNFGSILGKVSDTLSKNPEAVTSIMNAASGISQHAKAHSDYANSKSDKVYNKHRDANASEAYEAHSKAIDANSKASQAKSQAATVAHAAGDTAGAASHFQSAKQHAASASSHKSEMANLEKKHGHKFGSSFKSIGSFLKPNGPIFGVLLLIFGVAMLAIGSATFDAYRRGTGATTGKNISRIIGGSVMGYGIGICLMIPFWYLTRKDHSKIAETAKLILILLLAVILIGCSVYAMTRFRECKDNPTEDNVLKSDAIMGIILGSGLGILTVELVRYIVPLVEKVDENELQAINIMLVVMFSVFFLLLGLAAGNSMYMYAKSGPEKSPYCLYISIAGLGFSAISLLLAILLIITLVASDGAA